MKCISCVIWKRIGGLGNHGIWISKKGPLSDVTREAKTSLTKPHREETRLRRGTKVQKYKRKLPKKFEERDS